MCDQKNRNILKIPAWASIEWVDEFHSWIQEKLSALNMRQIGQYSQPHFTPWATVIQIPTDQGMIYFKAVAPVLKHEIVLSMKLSELEKDNVLPILAQDLEQGWMLMPDGGLRMRELIRSSRQPGIWFQVLPLYVRFQDHCSEYASELLKVGAPDRRLDKLPGLYQILIEDKEVLSVDEEHGVSSEELHKLFDHKSLVEEYSSRLAAFTIPETLNHGDFHDGNVFVRKNGFYFFDWGDSSITHPFFSLRTMCVSLEISLDWEDDDPRCSPFVDTYLQAWKAYETMEKLRSAFSLSRVIAPIISALSWRLVVSSLPVTQRDDYSHAIPGLLKEFLENARKV